VSCTVPHPRCRLVAALTLLVFGFAGGLLATSTVTVRSGDSLSKFAAQHGTSVRALADANGITNPDRIRIGQTLVIPDPSAPGANASTTTTLAAAALTTANATPNAAAPSATVTTSAPATTSRPEDLPQAPASVVPKDVNPAGSNYGTLSVTTYFVVQPGDSFSSISRRFGLEQRHLAASNGLHGSEMLVPGQLLRIA
jgi:LysM repeat protein